MSEAVNVVIHHFEGLLNWDYKVASQMKGWLAKRGRNIEKKNKYLSKGIWKCVDRLHVQVISGFIQ